MNVALLPTGRTEWHGMTEALARLFPTHTFYAVPTAIEVDSYPDRFPYDGFTSNPLTHQRESDPPESALELVGRAAQEAVGDRRSVAADLVMILDDLELANLHQPDRVVRVFRAAVASHLQSLQGARERTAATLRQKVYFLLAMSLPIDEAEHIERALIDQAAETGDHTVSDGVVLVLNARRTREPQKGATAKAPTVGGEPSESFVAELVREP